MHPALAGDGRIIQKLQQNSRRVLQGRQLTLLPLPELQKIRRGLLQQLVLLDRRVIRQGSGRHLGSHVTVMQHAHHGFLQHLTHHGGLQTPASEALHQCVFATSLHHKQHPLLGFRKQELVCRHAVFASRNPIEIKLNPQAALRRHLRTAAGESGSPHVLSCNHITTGECLQTGLDQPLLQEGITHLNRRTVIQGVSTEFSTGEAGTAHAIPTRGAADVDHRIAHPLGAGLDDLLGLHQTQSHGIHQGIAPIGGIKGHFTAHGGNPDAIAVMGNAGDNALYQTDIDGIIQRSETQRVEQRDRSGSHGEDVPQDPANPGGGTLEGLHRGWVVMTFNLEGQPMAIPQIDHASVFTWTHQDPRSVRWKATQQRP